DMYLACACALGVGAALAAFESRYADAIRTAVASVEPSHAFVQDVSQATCARLLVHTAEGPGKIASYAGRATLRAWLSAIGTGDAISQRRRKSEKPHAAFEEARDPRVAGGGPELEYLRGRYAGEFEDAVHVAIERLPAKQRMLLRLHFVDRMTVDKL